MYARQQAAINKGAINAAINTPEIRLGADEGTTPPVASTAGPSSPAPRTANRRDRAVYNEYMRRKMREYRAKRPS